VKARIIEWLKERRVDSATGPYGRALVIGLPAGIHCLDNNGLTTNQAVVCFAEEIEILVYELVGREHLKKERP
jgi:hypothetical protein